jgi:hypothetical protein
MGAWLTWLLQQTFALLKPILPSIPAYWLDSFARYPAIFLIVAFALLWLFFRTSAALQDQVFTRAEYAWRRVKR